ncbi:MAG: hypothetical protein LBT05_02405 [Planctomycetaceae bacterium]|jgi:hypothetical protein|nr:hypothetical protein [Planctomycetaceae bacterium]
MKKLNLVDCGLLALIVSISLGLASLDVSWAWAGCSNTAPTDVQCGTCGNQFLPCVVVDHTPPPGSYGLPWTDCEGGGEGSYTGAYNTKVSSGSNAVVGGLGTCVYQKACEYVPSRNNNGTIIEHSCLERSVNISQADLYVSESCGE